jgi:MinD-like ATPase involved in chromosome partitioning or flagellar assembly
MLEKKITIWTKKGGCGKTNIAGEIALRLEYPAITNEQESMLSLILPKDRLKMLSPDEDVPNFDCGMIFDFGGYIDGRIIEALKQSDFVLVPTLPEASEIQSCISTIQAIKKYNNNIVVIANKTEIKEDFETIESAIKQIGDYPVFEIKKSRALPSLYTKKKSIKQLMEESPLLRYSYKKISKQFDDLIEHLVK